MSLFLNCKFGFVAKIGKRSVDTPKGYVRIAEAFTADLRRAVPFKNFSDAQAFAKENSLEYWAVVSPSLNQERI